MIEFHDPRGEVAAPQEPYQLNYDVAEQIAGGVTPTIGLLANGFPDSENFLTALGTVLKARSPGIEIALWNKGNASIPAPQEMLDEIRESCQVAIAAYGH